MKKTVALSLILLWGSAYAEPVHPCAAAATKQAARLLEFHSGPDDRMGVEKTVKVLSPIKNPVNKKQTFDVLEVWGNIYKGRYRMHLIYARIGNDCLLMGQEIIEFASL
jgi:hypothetical protein